MRYARKISNFALLVLFGLSMSSCGKSEGYKNELEKGKNVDSVTFDIGKNGSFMKNVTITKDTAHGFIYFGSGESQVFLYLSEIKGPKGDTGATGPAGPVNMVSTLDTTDTTNAVTNNVIATAIEDVVDQIGTITSAQSANLTLLGS